MGTITTQRVATWDDVISFLQLHQGENILMVAEGRDRAIYSADKMLAAIMAAREEGNELNNGWRPGHVGTYLDQPAISLTDYWARTRWLLPGGTSTLEGGTR